MSYKKLLAISSLALIGLLGCPPAGDAAIVNGGQFVNGVNGNAPCGRIFIYNPLGNWVWLTIYTLDRVHILDSGPMGGHAAVTVKDSSILCGSYYAVRAQIMGGPSGNTVVCDTGAQIYLTLTANSGYESADVSSQTVTVENCYFGEGNSSIPFGMGGD